MPKRSRRALPGWTLLALVASALGVSCKDDPPKRTPPPPPQPAAGCAGSAKVADPNNVRLLPKRLSDFCLDPAGSDRGFGEKAKQPLDGICELFDGECEIYKRHGVTRVVEARYVHAEGSQATINVYLSTFGRAEEAFAMFTKRTIGDGDPAMSDAVRPLEAGGQAALGIGNAYLWRGKYLAELTYNDSSSDVKTLRARADAQLTPLAKKLGSTLAGALVLPDAAAALPTANRLPLGIRYLMRNALKVKGGGRGASGYYRDGQTRWRAFASPADETASKATFAAFAKTPKAQSITPAIGEQTVAVSLDLAAPASGRVSRWMIARCNHRVVGIGDEWLGIAQRKPKTGESKPQVLDDKQKRSKLEALCKPPTTSPPK